MTTLVNAIRSLAPRGGGRSGASGFFAQGRVTAVGGAGGLTISVQGQSVDATPATDEPFIVGMLVWAAESTEGWVVIGGVR
jgi:hypothetical protein